MPLIVGGALTLGGIAGKAFNKSPQFNPLTGDYGVNGDYSYQAGQDYGQGTAKENMNRYGFQGVYQNYLTSETERMKKDEMARIQKLASGLVPGQASLRGGIASQGMNGATSNVIARQQREQGLGKALDEAGSMSEASNARLDNNLFQATTQNEGLRFGASQDYMKAVGMATQGQDTMNQFNEKMEFGKDSFNAESRFKRDSFNAQGQFQQDQAGFNKWNDIFGDIGGIGSSMVGAGVADYYGNKGPGGDVAEGFTSDGKGGFDWKNNTPWSMTPPNTNRNSSRWGVPDYNRPH